MELDRGLAAFLRETFAARARGRGRCASSRATRWTRTSCTWSPPPYDVVANLPYHITSPILHGSSARPRGPSGWC